MHLTGRGSAFVLNDVAVSALARPGSRWAGRVRGSATASRPLSMARHRNARDLGWPEVLRRSSNVVETLDRSGPRSRVRRMYGELAWGVVWLAVLCRVSVSVRGHRHHGVHRRGLRGVSVSDGVRRHGLGAAALRVRGARPSDRRGSRLRRCVGSVQLRGGPDGLQRGSANTVRVSHGRNGRGRVRR